MAGLASLLGAYNSDSDNEEEVEIENLTRNNVKAEENRVKTNWVECVDKANPYFWNIETREVVMAKPDELVKYLRYAERHKDALLKSYGEKRWITHSGTATNGTFYLDQLFRRVTWTMPASLLPRTNELPCEAESAADDIAVDSAPQPPSTTDTCRSAVNYSPPPLFANVATTVTVEEIDEAAGLHHRPEMDCARKDEEVESSRSCVRVRSGMAEDFVIASKRRRRIEIPRIAKRNPVKGAKQEEEEHGVTEEGMPDGGMNIEMIGPDKMSKEKASYLNSFHAGGVEFIDKQTTRKNVDADAVKATTSDDEAVVVNDRGDASGKGEENDTDNLSDNAATGGADGRWLPTAEAAMTINGGEKKKTAKREQEDPQQRSEIKSIAELVNGKIKFLSEGRPAVSGVQAMAIQLETLLAAYEASELGVCYLERWLRSTAEQLQQLEAEVAPDGWRCKWDSLILAHPDNGWILIKKRVMDRREPPSEFYLRKFRRHWSLLQKRLLDKIKPACDRGLGDQQRYFYESLATGKRQWEFPQTPAATNKVVAEEVVERMNDEMDISTTPPHESVPEFEMQRLKQQPEMVAVATAAVVAPPLPPPPPPPQDMEELKPPPPPTFPPPLPSTDSEAIGAYQLSPMLGWNVHPAAMASGMGSSASLTPYELPSGSGIVVGNGGNNTERLNFELDSFYSDIASIECNQVAGQDAQESEGLMAVPTGVAATTAAASSSTSGSSECLSINNKGSTVMTVVDKVSRDKKKKKKVKTSLSDIKDMSHLISKWQKAQQDL